MLTNQSQFFTLSQKAPHANLNCNKNINSICVNQKFTHSAFRPRYLPKTYANSYKSELSFGNKNLYQNHFENRNRY